MRGVLWLAAVMAVLALTSAAPPSGARADAGVSLDRGGLFIVEQLEGGGRYTLPVVTVRNPGDEPSAYRMTVLFLEETDARRPDPAWFTFEPATFELGPGERQPVSIVVELPGDVRPDDYEALVQAEMVSGTSGTSVGAAAAAPVTFTVTPESTWQEWRLRVGGWVDGAGIWGYAVAIAVLSGAAVLLGGRFTGSTSAPR
jgi:hypothetical protein